MVRQIGLLYLLLPSEEEESISAAVTCRQAEAGEEVLATIPTSIQLSNLQSIIITDNTAQMVRRQEHASA